jgi:hypothetical protein
MIEKTNLFFDIENLKKECFNLIDQYKLKQNQICLMHSDICIDKWHDGVGSLYRKIIENKSKIIKKEYEYNIINEQIKDSYIEYVLKQITQTYTIFRARFMVMPPRFCYSWHKDFDKRLHIAIQTNKNCRMVFEEKSYHIPSDGFLYDMNTTLYHSAFNGDDQLNRIHLVISKK